MVNFELFKDAIEMKETDRVPCLSTYMHFPGIYSGKTLAEFTQDKKIFRECFNKVLNDFPSDMLFPTSHEGLRIHERLGLNTPDHSAKQSTIEQEKYDFQFEERKTMEVEDYDFFLQPKVNALQFLTKRIIPRSYGIDLTDRKKIKQISAPFIERAMKNMQSQDFIDLEDDDTLYFKYIEVLKENNYPMYVNGIGIAPFDLLSFLFRGLENLSIDLFRVPEKVDAFCKKWGEFQTMMLIKASNQAREMIQKAMPDWKIDPPGAAIFCERAFSLSPKQFQEFYLPSLNHLAEIFIKNNFRPILIFEQECTHLLEEFKRLPGPNKCSFLVDTTDIKKAKQILGDHMSLIGNVPQNLLIVGTSNQIDKYCKELIEDIGSGGGFILSPALLVPDEAKPENVKTMINSVQKYKPK